MFYRPPDSTNVCLTSGTLALIARRFDNLETRVTNLTLKVYELETELKDLKKRKDSEVVSNQVSSGLILPDLPSDSDTSGVVGSSPVGGPPTPLPIPSPVSPLPKRQRTS